VKIHIAALGVEIIEDIELLRKIVAIVHGEGHTLAHDWIEPAYAKAKKGNKASKEEWAAMYVEGMDAVAKADIVIAEASKRSFGVGYQVAMAVQHKKPTLILKRQDSPSGGIVAGLEEQTVSIKTYTDATLERYVSAFLRENDIPLKDMRFNFFITRNIYNYLRAASARTGKTKAELIRELVKDEISKENR